MGDMNTFQRIEKKYCLNPFQYEEFIRRSADKIHADQYGLHTIRNIYYDTNDFELIRESLEKPKYKEKLRLRGYGDIHEDSRVFLEIKKKYAGVVYKRRTDLLMKDAMQFLETKELPDHADQIMREIHYFMNFYNPEPKVYLAYDRVAYVGNEDGGLRITVDRNIRSRFHRLELAYDGECRILNPGTYLMEIKVPSAYPLWLADLLCDLKIYPVSFSKYGTVYAENVMEAREEKGAEPQPSEETQVERKNKREYQREEEKQICLQVY
ncbi:MAG: polyphosphate polymerase domain-containing protein [Bariatricus sp.]